MGQGVVLVTRFKLFVYETLRSRLTLKKALAGLTPGAERRAVLPGWSEIFVGEGKTHATKWPTIIPSHNSGGSGNVKGDIILVTREELKRLDKWEANYVRVRVPTSDGEAWTYVYARGKDL